MVVLFVLLSIVFIVYIFVVVLFDISISTGKSREIMTIRSVQNDLSMFSKIVQTKRGYGYSVSCKGDFELIIYKTSDMSLISNTNCKDNYVVSDLDNGEYMFQISSINSVKTATIQEVIESYRDYETYNHMPMVITRDISFNINSEAVLSVMEILGTSREPFRDNNVYVNTETNRMYVKYTSSYKPTTKDSMYTHMNVISIESSSTDRNAFLICPRMSNNLIKYKNHNAYTLMSNFIEKDNHRIYVTAIPAGYNPMFVETISSHTGEILPFIIITEETI